MHSVFQYLPVHLKPGSPGWLNSPALRTLHLQGVGHPFLQTRGALPDPVAQRNSLSAFPPSPERHSKFHFLILIQPHTNKKQSTNKILKQVVVDKRPTLHSCSAWSICERLFGLLLFLTNSKRWEIQLRIRSNCFSLFVQSCHLSSVSCIYKQEMKYPCCCHPCCCHPVRSVINFMFGLINTNMDGWL